MKILAVIDPIEDLNPKKDTSLALLTAAARKGIDTFVTTLPELFALKNTAYARANHITLNDKTHEITQVGSHKTYPLHTFDIILMRKDPPFNQNYIYATYLLELAKAHGTIVSNNPQGLRDANEKCFILQFPDLITETLVSACLNTHLDFWQQHKKTILKPLDGMGGRGIFYINEQGDNLNGALEVLTRGGTQPIMQQPFIPEIKTMGDRRILVVGDSIIPYAYARFPSQGDFRGNLAAGGTGKVMPLSQDDIERCEQLIPVLQRKGLDFVGIDMIGPYITEINVTSPTCLQEIATVSQIDIATQYLEYLTS